MTEVPQVLVGPDGHIAQLLPEQYDSAERFDARTRTWLVTWMTDVVNTRIVGESHVAGWTPLVEAEPPYRLSSKVEWLTDGRMLVDGVEAGGPTPDQAAALALYEAARWVGTYRDAMRVRSAHAKAAEGIYSELMDRARRRHLGDLYDPAIDVDEESLRAQIAAQKDIP